MPPLSSAELGRDTARMAGSLCCSPSPGGAHGPRVFSECHPPPARCRTEAPLANPGGALLCLVTIAEINTEHLGRGPGVGPSTSSVTPAQLGQSQPRPTVLGAECLPLVSLFSLTSYPRNPFQSGGL